MRNITPVEPEKGIETLDKAAIYPRLASWNPRKGLKPGPQAGPR